MGYQNKHIIKSILIQFGLISVIGGVLGIVATIMVKPLIATTMGSQLGLVWYPRIDPLVGGISLLSVALFILLLTYLSVHRIKKLYPLTALHDNLTTRIKKNYFSLEQAKGSLTLLMSLKQLLQNKKQMLMMTFIVAGLMFAGVTSLTFYQNMVVDNEALGNIIGGALGDVSLIVRAGEDVEEIRERVYNMSEVAQLYGAMNVGRMPANEMMIAILAVEDVNYLRESFLVEGELPRGTNEIAISPVLVDQEGFAIGGTVRISNDGNDEVPFLVTGVVQATLNAGLFGMLTEDGFRRIDPEFVPYMININLVDGVDADEFIVLVVASEGDVFDSTLNFRSVVDASVSGMSAALTPVTYGIIIISGVVIALVQYMLIKMMITRRHKELGIQKALGFSSFSLMNQISLNLLPIVAIGTVIGSIVGYFSFNPLFVALMSSEGIGAADLPIPVGFVVLLASGMIITSYVAAMLIARRVRQISAYKLVSES